MEILLLDSRFAGMKIILATAHPAERFGVI